MVQIQSATCLIKHDASILIANGLTFTTSLDRCFWPTKKFENTASTLTPTFVIDGHDQQECSNEDKTWKEPWTRTNPSFWVRDTTPHWCTLSGVRVSTVRRVTYVCGTFSTAPYVDKVLHCQDTFFTLNHTRFLFAMTTVGGHLHSLTVIWMNVLRRLVTRAGWCPPGLQNFANECDHFCLDSHNSGESKSWDNKHQISDVWQNWENLHLGQCEGTGPSTLQPCITE